MSFALLRMPGTAPARPAWPTRPWWHPVALGVLWGIAVNVMEMADLPLSDGSLTHAARVAVGVVAAWCAVGVAIALLVELVGDRLDRVAPSIAGAMLAAPILSAVWSVLYGSFVIGGFAHGVATVFPHGVDPLGAYAYQTWIVLFYGGLYLFAWRTYRRAQRTRSLLAEAEAARVRAETLLGEAQLAALRGHVDPALLLRVMEEVERRYRHWDAAAERLLGRLVAFLRLAMPAVRSGRSTLCAEMALARAYRDLRAELDARDVRWTVAGDVADDLPFPPLLLLPLLDAQAAAALPGAPCMLRIVAGDGAVALQFHGVPPGRGDWLPPALGYRVRVALSAEFGAAWTMAVRDTAAAGVPALEIVLRTPAGGRDGAVCVDAGTAPSTAEEVIDATR